MRFYQQPSYVNLVKDWNQYQAYYEGLRVPLLKTNNLWLHEFETDAVKGGNILRDIREQRTRYVNLCIAIVQKYVAMVFKNEADFSEVKDFFTPEEWADIDGNGNSLETYIHKIIASDYFVYGRIIDEITSDDKERVYFQHWQPEHMPDWQLSNDQDEFYTMTYKEILHRTSASEKPKMEQFLQYLKLDGNKYAPTIYRQQGQGDGATWTEVDTIETGLDFIPVTVTDGASWVDRIMPILMSRYNLQSCLDNILNYQGHQKTYISGGNEGDGMIINEAGVVILPEGSTVTLTDPITPTGLTNRLEEVTTDLFRVAFFQNRVLPTNSKSAESADNQYAQKEDLNGALKLAGEAIATHVNDLVANFVAYKKKDIGEKKISFDFNFDIDDQDFLDITTLFFNDIKKYPTWQKETYKRAAKKMNLDETDAIVEEIDKTEIVAEVKPRLSLAGALVGQTE